MELIKWLLSTKEFPPRWECGIWDNFTGWTFIIASLGIFAAYYSIPFILVILLKKVNLHSNLKSVLALFSIFIFACGTGHLLDTVMFYYPAYRLLALMHVITAAVSWLTVFVLVPKMDYFLSMQDPQKMLELNKKLEAANADLKRLNDELEQFSYVASHDLKSPLRAIGNLATWLQEDCGDQLPDKGKDHLKLMVGRIARMNALIDGLLQVSRVGRLNTELEDVDLNIKVSSILESIDSKKFTINVSPLPVVRANKVSMYQVFSNLIVNGIKHHPRDDGVINITYEELPNFHQFTIADDGDGIPLEYQSKLFVMFQTLKPKDKTDSTGIGLALCKKIIEHFGGYIRLESDSGKGAKFIFTIPR